MYFAEKYSLGHQRGGQTLRSFDHSLAQLHRDIIVIGTSAGGVEALKEFVGHLPKELPASIFVVLHIPTDSRSMLPEILNVKSPLMAAHAENDETFEHGRIYVAPPNHHLMLLEGGKITLSRGPRENRSRPAIDPLFRTAARNYGERVIAILLTGTMDDGVAGMIQVKQRGGLTIAQDPREALFPEMPQTAIVRAGVHHILPVYEIAVLLDDLVRRPLTNTQMNQSDAEDKAKSKIEQTIQDQMEGRRNGTTATYSCPECGGVLWESDQDNLIHFRCHVGHTYSAEALLADQSDNIEAALWSALRALKEKAILSRQLASDMRTRGSNYSAERFEEQATDLEKHIETVNTMLLSPGSEQPAFGAGGNAPTGATPGGGDTRFRNA